MLIATGKTQSIRRRFQPVTRVFGATSGRVLRNAASKRPVLLCDLDQVDHDVLRPRLQLGLDVVDDAFVERLLELDRTPRVQRNLDEDDVIAVTIAQDRKST